MAKQKKYLFGHWCFTTFYLLVFLDQSQNPVELLKNYPSVEYF